MSSEWREQTLGECLLKIVDNRGKTPPLEAAETPYGVIEINAIVGSNKSPNLKAIRKFVSAETYNSWFRAGHPKPGDLLFSTVGSIAEVAMFDGKNCCIAQNIIGLRPNREIILPNYLYYALVSPAIQLKIRALDISSVQPSIKVPHLLATTIQVPPLELQEHIGTILSTLDDRIALLRETNATLEAIAQALFKSWFVDFDPVHAKARGEPPQGMDDATAALFPDSFEESELGMIPKGWRVVPFGQLLSHTIGGDWGDEIPNEKNDTQVAIIRGTDMPDLQSGMMNRVPIRYTSQKKLASRKLQDGDLVLEVSGGSKDQPTGRSLYMTNGLLSQFDCPVEPASFCRLLRPAEPRQGLLLAQHLIYIYADGKTWQYQNQSTGIANFQTTHFFETELVVVPSEEILDSFSATVRPMIDRSHLTQISQLAALRDTLLPKLISGQLRLPEAQVLLAEELP